MRRCDWLVILLIVCTGCRDGTPSPTADSPAPVSTVSTKYDASSCGTISGRVRWTGPLPAIPTIESDRLLPGSYGMQHTSRPNPHAPKIDPATNGVGGLVVFLRGINADFARPWDHAPVTVVMHDEQPIIRQGDEAARLVGFVHRGDAVTFVSEQSVPHSARARGAAFFTLTLPEPHKLRRRTFNEIGRVEISSANGHVALRGHLFVDDHPYYAVTNSDGQFQIPKVPAGTYELVWWRPDWRVDHKERDPETLTIVRLSFVPPKETSVPVTIRPGDTASVVMEVGAE